MGRRRAPTHRVAARQFTSIYIVGFRGTGNDQPFAYEAPLIQIGHVGISFVQGGPVYGFHPNETYLDSVIQSGRDPINELFEGIDFPGQVFDDTAVFLRAWYLARQYPEAAKPPTVRDWRSTVGSDQFWSILESVLRLLHAEVTTERYALPDLKIGKMRPGCYSCALWPATLGIALPSESGLLKAYIPAMKPVRYWQPDSVLLNWYRIPGV